ncbi:hypothetical protein CRH09_25560 [Nocardia terpenica]|uniref:Uncharacterized protein n=1 Tax=Nocardia terpenica TaxID=455432 RepID=A0A291RPC1_9NOCA|nr:hypothetical protein CRH09_25560 [Nocardia terpenica]
MGGESALGERGNGIHTDNITTASRAPVHDSFTYLHTRSAKMLAANDFSCFSVIARHPRTDSDPVIYYDDLKAMSSQLQDCRTEMTNAKRHGGGPALRSLLTCSKVHDEL